jgi:hypothetical protein
MVVSTSDKQAVNSRQMGDFMIVLLVQKLGWISRRGTHSKQRGAKEKGIDAVWSISCRQKEAFSSFRRLPERSIGKRSRMIQPRPLPATRSTKWSLSRKVMAARRKYEHIRPRSRSKRNLMIVRPQLKRARHVDGTAEVVVSEVSTATSSTTATRREGVDI